MKAVFVRDLSDFNGEAKLYAVSPPVTYSQGYGGDVDSKTADHVVVSKVSNAWVRETYLFPATAEGDVASWAELGGSTKGECSHEDALCNAGYETE